MSIWKAYIAPLQAENEHGDFIEITQFVVNKNIGAVNRMTENNEYDVGIAPNDSMGIKLSNDNGDFSEPGSVNSIFPYKRAGSKFKITYLFDKYPPICGFAVAGISALGPEIEIYEGILNDQDAEQDIETDTISFTILGYSAALDGLETVTTGISTSDTVQSALFKLMNRIEFTNLVLVDNANINPGVNPTISTFNGATTFLDDTTVKEAVTRLLEASGSILYIENNTVYVSARTPSSAVEYEFFGQAAKLGLENIQDIKDYKIGTNRTFNLWKWEDTTLTSRSATSIGTYGALKKTVNYSAVTQATYRQTLLDYYKTEFSEPKIELDLYTPIDYERIGLQLMDKVTIDYPNVPIAIGDGSLPVWNTGSMVWQEESTFDPNKNFFSWPDGLFNISIDPNTEWKIIGIKIDSKDDIMNLKLREI